MGLTAAALPLTPMGEGGRLYVMVVACTLGASIPAGSNLRKKNLFPMNAGEICSSVVIVRFWARGGFDQGGNAGLEFTEDGSAKVTG